MMILQWKYYPDFQLWNFRVSSVSPGGGRTLYLIHPSYVFTTKGPNSGASQPSLFSSVMILQKSSNFGTTNASDLHLQPNYKGMDFP
nr:hypothetical protein CFP56_45599 [Quercus suber]